MFLGDNRLPCFTGLSKFYLRWRLSNSPVNISKVISFDQLVQQSLEKKAFIKQKMKPESRAASKINFYNIDSHVCHKKT